MTGGTRRNDEEKLAEKVESLERELRDLRGKHEELAKRVERMWEEVSDLTDNPYFY